MIRYIFYVTIFLTTVLAENTNERELQPLTQKQINLEKQKLELDYKRYKLDKAKFQLEQQKRGLAPEKTIKKKPEIIKPDIYLGVELFSGSGRRNTTKGLNSDLVLDELYISGSTVRIGFIGKQGHRFEIEAGSKIYGTNSIDWQNIMILHSNLYYVTDFPNKFLIPFFKFGIGKDEYKYTDENLGTTTSIETNFGVGVFMPLKEISSELSGSIIFHQVEWQGSKAYDSDGNTVQTDVGENYATLNLGFNILF